VPERHQLFDSFSSAPRDLKAFTVDLERVEVTIAGRELIREVMESPRERPRRRMLAPGRDRSLVLIDQAIELPSTPGCSHPTTSGFMAWPREATAGGILSHL
jgi:hypothetical protein